MADVSLHSVRDKTLEISYLHKLEERTAKREAERAYLSQQTKEAARARQSGDAHSTRAAQTRRSLDDDQRRRDAQLAIDLRRFDQDRLDTARLKSADQVAADQARLAQAREGVLRAEDVRAKADTANATDTSPSTALAAEQQAAQDRAIEALTRNAGQDPNRGVIVDVLA